MNNTIHTGIRTKILEHLHSNPCSTAAEMTELFGADRKVVIDNLAAARKEGYLTSQRDDVTTQMGYTLTPKGRARVTNGRQTINGKTKAENVRALEEARRDLVLIAEGYATAATLHDATGLPVVIHDGAPDCNAQAQAPAQLDGDDQAQDLAVKDDPPGFEARVTALTMVPDGAALFHERATKIRLADEAAGEFVEVIQQSSYDDDFAIRIEPSEWPALRAAIDRMVAECRL